MEGFEFDGKHTSEFNLRLIDRQADPPLEKKIIENIPFMQGNLDFSAMLGQRVFENRQLMFNMLIINYDYQKRKNIETSLTNWLMGPSFLRLYDDFSPDYYYLAKCETINYVDRYEGMTAVITFDAYPFKKSEQLEGNDVWDSFNFELDVAQITEFKISESETIKLYNNGSNMVTPKIIASNEFEIIKGSQAYIVPAGTSESSEFTLDLGENDLTVNGNGTIEFQFYKELL